MTLKLYSQLTSDQLGAIDYAEGRTAGGLWMDVGTGKTVSILTALDRLRRRFDIERVLVVGPRLVAERVWSTEVKEWEHLQHLRVERITGTPEARKAALAREADIYVITRDNLPWLRDQYILHENRGTEEKPRMVWRQVKPFPFDTLVLDESQSFKEQGSARSKAARQLRKLVQRCYLATGSFIPNGYRDAWHQAFLLDGGRTLGTAESHYLSRYFRTVMLDGYPTYEILPTSPKEIDEKLAGLLHIVRDAQPPAPTNFIRVPLSQPELTAYRRMARTNVLEAGGHTITAVNAGVLWGKLLQLANGAIYDETKQWHVVHDKKIEALVELLESLPRPVLIGYGFVHDVERIRMALQRSGATGVGLLRTNASLDDWRAGKIKVGIMHPASAGHGLNDLYVSGCRHLVWFGIPANREYYDQLNGRLTGGHRRTGKTVTIHHLVTEGTIDEDACKLLECKGETQVESQIRILNKIKESL